MKLNQPALPNKTGGSLMCWPKNGSVARTMLRSHWHPTEDHNKSVAIMAYRIGVKPGRALSTMGMIVGIAFVLLGIFVAIPMAGLFGIFWTIVALAITLYHGYNAFSSKGAATYDVNIDGGNVTSQLDADLRKLAKLKDDGPVERGRIRPEAGRVDAKVSVA